MILLANPIIYIRLNKNKIEEIRLIRIRRWVDLLVGLFDIESMEIKEKI
jgi:hypothetical protein